MLYTLVYIYDYATQQSDDLHVGEQNAFPLCSNLQCPDEDLPGGEDFVDIGFVVKCDTEVEH